MDDKCILNLNKLYFQNIEFKRIGEKNDNEVRFQIETEIMQKSEEEIYKVVLRLKGVKELEYNFIIEVVGVFSISEVDCPSDFKKEVISKNTIAILMPYLRSEVSILTAQPGIDCVVLPPFNINAMMNEVHD